MAQTACSYCGADNASEAAYCSRCQRPLKSASAPRPNVRLAPRAAEPARSAAPASTPPPTARPTVRMQAELDQPTRVGPPPQFAPRTQAPQTQPQRPAPTPGRRAPGPQGPSARPTVQMPPSAVRPQPAAREAQPRNEPDDNDKTQITPARLSPLMQRLTPKVQAVSSQQTVLLSAEDMQPQKAARPPPQAAAQAPPARAAVHEEKTTIGMRPTLPRPAPAPAPAAIVAPARVAPRTPVMPVAETVIIDLAPAPDAHSERTILASTPLKPPAALHQDPTVSERAPKERSAVMRGPAAPGVTTQPAPTRQPVQLPEEVVNTDTTVGAPNLAQLPKLALATCIDAAVIGATGWAWAATEMLLFDGSWPAERAGLEAVAVWMHIYAAVAVHTAVVTGGFALFYSALGAHDGRTLGRAALGLTLVRTSGDKPSWPWALWHASASVLLSSLWGAGLFWMIVDARRRTWGNLMSKSVVCAQ